MRWAAGRCSSSCHVMASHDSRCWHTETHVAWLCPIRLVALWPYCVQLHMPCAHKGKCVTARFTHTCAADLWHAHTRGVSNPSPPVSYVNQYTQTNGRHMGSRECPHIPGNYISQAPLPLASGFNQ